MRSLGRKCMHMRLSSNSRGKQLGRWKDSVKEYMCEKSATSRGWFEQVRRECLGRERWSLYCGHLFEEHSWRE